MGLYWLIVLKFAIMNIFYNKGVILVQTQRLVQDSPFPTNSDFASWMPKPSREHVNECWVKFFHINFTFLCLDNVGYFKATVTYT